MLNDPLPTLVTALDIAAFERTPDGSFRALAPLPAWFARLARDETFPFLGHILDEAQTFWRSRRVGVREWGPCAEVDDGGKEFHFLVKAVSDGVRGYLVLQLDTGAERMREVLQKVRAEALEAAQKKGPAEH